MSNWTRTYYLFLACLFIINGLFYFDVIVLLVISVFEAVNLLPFLFFIIVLWFCFFKLRFVVIVILLHFVDDCDRSIGRQYLTYVQRYLHLYFLFYCIFVVMVQNLMCCDPNSIIRMRNKEVSLCVQINRLLVTIRDFMSSIVLYLSYTFTKPVCGCRKN